MTDNLSYHDYERQCLDQMSRNGITFSGPLLADSKFHRFSMDGKKNQPDEWYVAHYGDHGSPYLICSYGTWSGAGSKYTYKSYEETFLQKNEIEKEQLRKMEKKLKEEREAQIKIDQQKRVDFAQKLWSGGNDHVDVKTAGYLERKKVKPFGVRLNNSNGFSFLTVPIRNIEGEIKAVQCIKEDGEKRIHGLKKGNFHILGQITERSKIYISEGYATGASIHEAIGNPVVVAFDCHNLDSVMGNLKGKYTSNEFLIAADDDRETNGNPGRTKAEEAAKKYNCKVIYPRFPTDFRLPNDKCPTDFNDIHVYLGLDEVKKQLNEKIKTNLTAITGCEFLSLKIPPRQLILAPWLPEQGLAMIYAKRGIGKTFVALTIAYAIACGGEVLKWKAHQPRRVLYIDGEMPAATMQERLKLITKSFSLEPPDPSYFKLITPDFQDNGIRDLSSREGQMDVNEHLHDVDLVILDNLSTLVRSGNENEAESWILVQEWILSLRRIGKSVLFVHHAGKGGQQRGTSKREDVLDTVITLKQPNNYSAADGAKFEIYFEKARGFEGEQAQPFEVNLINHLDQTIEWVCKEIEDVDLNLVVELYKNGMTNQRDIAKEIGKSVGTVNKLVKKAKEGGLI